MLLITFCCYLSVAPTGIPQSLEVISRSATSVTLTWSLPSSDLRNGDISSYIIQYVVRGALHGSHVVTMDTSECEEAVEYTIDSLEPNTEYVFEVAARNQKGNGPFARIEFQTKKGILTRACCSSNIDLQQALNI